MKILIFCDMFPPAFGPRMGYLCKYLRQANWEPFVLTEYIKDDTFAFLSEGVPVKYMRYFRLNKKPFKQIEWISVVLADYLFEYKEKQMIRAAEKLIQKESFDGILCSTYRTFPLPAATYIARKYNLPIIADHRDIIEQYAADEFISKPLGLPFGLDKRISELFRSRLLTARNKALKEVDHVTTVSPWHVERLKQFNSNVSLIYNGFDPELFHPEQHLTSQFIMSYTGRLISLKTRDPYLLFEAIQELHKRKEITPTLFRIEWYVDSASEKILTDVIETFGIKDYMDFKGYVPAEKIPAILNNSSIAIQLANKTSKDGPKGIMTTKLFEALASERPLLCVRSDESFLEETIRNTHSGVAARTKKEVMDFIMKHYNFWKVNGYTSVSPNRKAISSFSRKKQAEQFMQIFEQLKG